MAKGFQEHKERQALLQSFGKDLARRAKSKCEVCEEAGVPLQILEIAPAPSEPDLDRCVFACERCGQALRDPKRKFTPNEWRTLGNTIWSEVPAIQVAVVRLLRRVSQEPDGTWAKELLDEAYLDEEVQEWADKE